ncbi:MmcQ/YjbR family DNA-binding protein [Streptomyces sp. NBC_01478]|uniref:MmcQ/YjbR family DNA-binding protein n=1 Tax=Streptomyces sp. NBC_01478 TaxID=2903882 RepID=UPI002E30748F|nr:MmcQ/YjbR family DNA-binding protein [Streptomyces sp. NBC_01478]
MSAAGDRLQDTARKAALALPDVSHGRPFTPGLDVYKVADKVFLIVTDDPDDQIITVKSEPEHARALERGYASITPGRFRDERCAGGGLGEGFGQGCGVAEGGVGAGATGRAHNALVPHHRGPDPVEFDLADSRVPPRARAALAAAGDSAFPERCTVSESITVFVR